MNLVANEVRKVGDCWFRGLLSITNNCNVYQINHLSGFGRPPKRHLGPEGPDLVSLRWKSGPAREVSSFRDSTLLNTKYCKQICILTF